MRRKHTEKPTTASHGQSRHAETRLLRNWLVFARVVWVVVLVLTVGLFIASIPFTEADARTICVTGACRNTSYLTPELVRELHQLGLSVDFYAFFIATWSIIFELVSVATGIVIFWRRSDDRMVLITSLALITFGDAFRGFHPEPSLSPLLSVSFLGMAFFGNCCIGFFFYTFPTGRFTPRWVGFLVLIWIAFWGFTNLVLASFIQPAGFTTVLFLSLLVSMVVVQVYRYRRMSTPAQRQQTKWVVFGVSLALLGVLGVVMVATIVPLSIIPDLIGVSLTNVFILLIPLSIGIAILRYRLWNIDIIMNRTLVYGTLTASIVGIYMLLVVVLGTVLRAEGNLLVSLFATGLVAVLFQPLRVWLQRGVNRLLYGQRDEPYTVIARLSQRLKETLAPDAVLSIIVETVAQALKLPYAAILWKQEETFELAASYGSPAGEPLTLPLVHQAEPIGQLQLAPRSPGEAFTPADLLLLDELARQAGLAAHAVRLATDLQKARERLVLAREEERRRLRRDLHDGVGPTLASLSQRIDTACHLVPHDQDAAMVQLRNLKAQVKSAIADIRRVVYALRPPILDELGLVSAIREHAMQFQSMDGLHVSVEAPETSPELSAAVEVATYRITLEALTNVERHAHAQHCFVHLEFPDERSLCFSIVDDGCGLPGEYHVGVGITSMRERAAELGGDCTLTSQSGGGTRVQVWLPLKSERGL